MKKNNYKLWLFILCALAAAPQTSLASSALKINDTTVLYTIDFSVTDEGFKTEIPVAAQYGAEYRDRIDTLGYTIATKNNSSVTFSKVQGAVLSKNEIVGERYVVEKGTKGEFTLLILATFSEKIQANSYQARITKFPYFLDGRRTTVHQNQLDELHMPTLVVKRTLRK